MNDSKPPTIDSPLTLNCGLTLKNRLCKSPTTEGLADEYNNATDRHATLYKRWAEGGAGLLITGNVQIDHRCLERAGNVVIEGEQSKEQMAKLTAWAQAGNSNGCNVWMQIGHAGRQTPIAINTRPFAPSEVQLDLLKNYGVPQALTEEQILDYVQRFAHASKVAQDAGFTGVQIHSAHGYLLSEFLSPLTNLREDQWGGSLENRARFLLATITATREAVGKDYPIAVKLNSADFQRGALSEEDARQVAVWLDEIGIDVLEISGGTYESPVIIGAQNEHTIKPKASTVAREAYFLEYAEQIRKVTKMPLIVAGGFRTVAGMNAALASGACDMLGIARPFCSDPDCAKKWLADEIPETSIEQRGLVLGPTKYLGPESSNTTIQALNTLSTMSWTYAQIFRMADGLEPNLDLSLFRAFLIHNIDEYKATKRLVKKRDDANH